MALPILDGNQSATTLSSILTGGEHIPAHTVVSLGTQAITDISGAVSGSVVSISNFPATQTIAGTVTANVQDLTNCVEAFDEGINQNVVAVHLKDLSGSVLGTSGTPLPISGTVTVGNSVTLSGVEYNDFAFWGEGGAGSPGYAVNTGWKEADGLIYDTSTQSPFPVQVISQGSVTIGSLPLIAGTVTANVQDLALVVGENQNTPNPAYGIQIGYISDISGTFVNVNDDPLSYQQLPIKGTVTIGSALPAGTNRIGVVTIGAGTVTIGAGTAQIGSVTASISGTVPISISSVTVGNSVTIASFATSVTARLINPAGTAVTYAEVGTAGSPSIDVLSVQGVTSGTAIPISISSVTIGSLPAISGTVTANLAISSTVITSGSFTSLTSATLVPANPARKMATVFNLGAGQLFINAGVTATTLGGGFMVALSSGDFYECDYTTTTLSAIFATAGTASWMSH